MASNEGSISLCRAVTSGKPLVLRFEKDLLKSFMQIRKSNEPRVEPCETPILNLHKDGTFLPDSTNSVRLLKKTKPF